MKKLANYKNIFFLLLLIGLLLRSYLHPGLPETHDGLNHLARFANYYLAIRESQIPPRIAPALFNHYGYPVFNYNYPLANILSLPFSFLKFNYELTYKIIASFFVLSGAIGCYLWLKSLEFKQKAITLGTATFLLSPYLYSLIIFRGNIGELMAMMLLPWLFYSIEEIINFNSQVKSLKFLFIIGIFTAFLLSHNVTVLFGLPIVFLYALLRLGKNLQAWKKLSLLFIFGLLNSLWFWLPAFFEKNQIILDQNSLSLNYLKQFPTFKQLLFAPLQFGFSFPGSVDSQSFALGLLNLVIFILALVLTAKKRDKADNLFLLFTLLALLLVLFQLRFTSLVWQVLPLGNYIQFPWRLSMFLAPIFAFLAAYLFEFKKLRKVLFIFLFLQIFVFLRVGVHAYSHFEKQDYEFWPKSTSSSDENLPKTFTYSGTDNWQPSAQILEGEGEVKTIYWRGSDRKYTLNLKTDATIAEPTMYFMGWQSVAKFNNQKFKINYLDNDLIAGRIAYKLPAGEYEIRSRFTQNTPARILGNSISAISMLLLLTYYGYKFYGKKQK